jgi:hypothetical protein
MLEEPVLLLGPSDTLMTRAVVSAAGAPLGWARWRAPGPWWRRWLTRRVLEVHEHEDDPLLFTVRRCRTILPWHEVRDADGRRVGFLLGGRVGDRAGQRVAVRQRLGDGETQVFRTPDGRTLAEVSGDEGGLRLSFAPAVAHDPFAKMLLLAAVLLAEG